MLKYWGKVVKSEDNSLVKKIYRRRKVELKQGSWCYYIRELLVGLNLEHFWISEEIGKMSNFISLIKQRIRQREWIVWLHEVAEKPKLRLYSFIKSNFGFEEYLFDMDNPCRKLLAQLRCGSSGLSIELDR